MRRTTAIAALAAVAALALPVPHASACTPALPWLRLGAERVVAGASVRVSGEIHDGQDTGCHMTPPTPSETPPPEAEVVTRSPDPGPTSIVTLPPLVPVAYAQRGAPGPLVTVTIAEYREWPEPEAPARPIARVPSNPVIREGDGTRHSFAARVRIPGDVRAGRYVLDAYEQRGVWFGRAWITVVDPLAATGSATADLVRVALLALLAGAGTLLVARRV